MDQSITISYRERSRNHNINLVKSVLDNLVNDNTQWDNQKSSNTSYRHVSNDTMAKEIVEYYDKNFGRVILRAYKRLSAITYSIIDVTMSHGILLDPLDVCSYLNVKLDTYRKFRSRHMRNLTLVTFNNL